MMKPGSMRTVCETILPGGRCPVVEDVLAPWDHDTRSDRFIVARSNFTASFTAGGERRIVRFVHTDERERDAIEAELDFLHHVADHGVWVNLPVASRNGRDPRSPVARTSWEPAIIRVFPALGVGEWPTSDNNTSAEALLGLRIFQCRRKYDRRIAPNSRWRASSR
jgi:Ser/Thr protein kinase RdoA (MazF antagonist)